VLSTRASLLREWGLFGLAALLPAAAIGVVGLRALDNEEAAIRREMRLTLQQATDRARDSYAGELLSADAPFAEPVELPPPVPTPARPAATPRSATDCDDLARRVGERDPRASADFVAGCHDARTATGRMLWPVVALSDAGRADEQALVTWLSRHGDDLSAAERASARAEVEQAAWLAPEAKSRLAALLDPGRSRDIAKAVAAANRHAMQSGRTPIVWSHERSRGALYKNADGSYSGHVIHPRSLGRALKHGWPAQPPELAARLVLGARAPEDEPSFEVLEGGAHVVVAFADPLAIERRTTRSKRLLLGMASAGGLCAVLLAAYLFARTRAERRLSALRTDFVAAVSHELRTPIASIRMLSELLAGDSIDDPAEQKEMHEALAREAKRLGDTVNRLLGFSRMEAGKLTFNRARQPLAPILERAIATIESRHPPLASATPSPIERSLPADIALAVDAEAIEMAVENLLTNAVKYAQPPYRVSLSLDPRHARHRGVRIAVGDAGPGLGKRDQRRVFRPFERADDRLSKATEGSGIGLSLVSHVARGHGGRAGVESEPGKGSTFFLWLPLEDTGVERESS
jgi:two-component system phosphate regulon sensor histidine kinase PhoR